MTLAVAQTVVGGLFDEWTVERVRQARRQMNDHQLTRLVGSLEHLDRAIADGNRSAVEIILRRCDSGPVRDCLRDLAEHHLGRMALTTDAEPTSKPAKVYRRDRPYSELSALCAPTGVWSSTGYRHLVIDADCFAGVNTNRHDHEPVGLLWRHRSAPVGLSRKWTLTDDGSLAGEFWIPGTREAQLVAQAAADRIVFPSVGVRFTSDWIHPDPDEWDPYTGVVDWCTHRWATVEEVSMTPNPQLPTAIETVW